MPIAAKLSLASEHSPAIGRERIRLLQAVARAGSISGGAREVGLSYKAAWDALEAMNNLFGTPLLHTQAGGKAGGGAALTPAGTKAIAAFERLEAEMAKLVRALEPDLAGTGISPLHLVSGLFMKTSARNALRGVVTRVDADRIAADVALKVSDETTIHALITAESVRELGLYAGREAIALIKASFVIIAPADTGPTSARNCIQGTVLRCETSAISAEVVLDVGGGKTLAATISAKSAEALGLAPGVPAAALFDAAHVILAIE